MLLLLCFVGCFYVKSGCPKSHNLSILVLDFCDFSLHKCSQTLYLSCFVGCCKDKLLNGIALHLCKFFHMGLGISRFCKNCAVDICTSPHLLHAVCILSIQGNQRHTPQTLIKSTFAKCLKIFFAIKITFFCKFLLSAVGQLLLGSLSVRVSARCTPLSHTNQNCKCQ